MPHSPISKVIAQLHTAALGDGQGDCTDAQLLDQFVGDRHESAVAALVRRHAAMVWGVCHRILPNHHDAEDAFQATFLVLVRKAASVRPRTMLANWLYGVAHHTALKARQTAARRGARERQVTHMPEPQAPPEDRRPELEPLLDQELSRLPHKYRAALVLCDLEGKTRKEAARQLGVPEGTISSRLATARVMLAKRLSRELPAMSTAALAAALAQTTASAAPPPALVASTIRVSTALATGRAAAGLVPCRVAALTQGVIKTMRISTMKTAAVLVMVAAFLVGGAVAAAWPFLAAQQSTPAATAQPSQEIVPPQAPRKPIAIRENAFIYRLAYSADGKTLATVGTTYDWIEIKRDGQPQKSQVRNCTVKLWDADTGQLKRSLGEEKHTTLWGLTYSPDRKTAAIAAGKPEKPGGWKVRLVDAQTWEVLHLIDVDGSVDAVVFSPDGKTLALGGGNHPRTETGAFLQLWDVATRKRIGGTPETRKDGVAPAANDPKRGFVTCLAYSPDGKLVAASDLDGKIRLYDGRTGEPKQVLEGHREMVNQVVFSLDGKTLVSGSYDKTARLWDVETAKVRQTLDGIEDYVMALATSPDGKLLATAEQRTDCKRITLWDARTGERKHVLPNQTMTVSTLAFSLDSRTPAVGGGHRPDVSDVNNTTGDVILFPLEALPGAQPVPGKGGDKPKTDLERLQGTWEFVSLTVGGKKVWNNDAPAKSLTFTGDKMQFVGVNGDGTEAVSHSRITLDESRKPKTIDLAALDGDHKGQTTPGRYEIDGDTLRLCLPSSPDGERPAALESKEGSSSSYLWTLKRKPGSK